MNKLHLFMAYFTFFALGGALAHDFATHYWFNFIVLIIATGYLILSFAMNRARRLE